METTTPPLSQLVPFRTRQPYARKIPFMLQYDVYYRQVAGLRQTDKCSVVHLETAVLRTGLCSQPIFIFIK